MLSMITFNNSRFSELKQHTATALYSDLKLPRKMIEKYQQNGESYWDSSSKDSVLKSLLSFHSFPQIVLDYRQCNYLLSNLVQNFCDFMRKGKHGKTMLASIWSQTGTATGRISSAHPNLQSLPKSALTFVCFIFFSLSLSSSCVIIIHHYQHHHTYHHIQSSPLSSSSSYNHRHQIV